MAQDIFDAIVDNNFSKLDELVGTSDALKEVTPNEKWNYLHKALLGGYNLQDKKANRYVSGKMVQHLIDAGLDINLKDCYGNTPLYYAVEQRNVEGVNALLAAGAEINTINRDGRTPLRESIKKPRNIELVQLLLDRGADPYQTASNGSTVKDFVKSACWDNPEMLKLFDVA